MKTIIDRYTIFGNPVAQSKSPTIHALFAEQTGQHLIYDRTLSEVDTFIDDITCFFNQGGKGCNVTAPFKLQAYQFADQLTERATLAGAINTLKKCDDGTILGDNTDGEGFIQDLLQHNIQIKDRRILLIGAGGAARGIIKPLLDQKPNELILSNRSFEKASQLEKIFSAFGSIISVPMENINQSFDLVINAASTSLTAEVPKISANIFTPQTISYDLSYGKEDTSFNQWAKRCGVTQTYDGLGMLVQQAVEGFVLWRGVRPHSERVLQLLRDEIT